MPRPLLVFAITMAVGACAARGPSPQLVADIAKADALLGEGCYTCLQEALAIFEKHLQAKRQPLGLADKAFNAALLVAVRELELGIPGEESMAKALRLLPSAPPSPVAPDKRAVVSRKAVFDAAQLVIGDTTSLDPEQRAQRTGRVRPPLEPDNPKRRALDAAPDTDLAAKYVALAIDCEQQKLIESVDAKSLAAAFAGVPLMQFRLSICGRPATPNVGALRASNPRWTDTLFWEGRRELGASFGSAIDFPKALGFYGQGREALPASLMLTMAWSNVSLSSEDFDAALSGFDDVIKRFPTHRDALNGRMQALSYLMRHPEAVAAATRLLDLGTWHLGDANYWRAWNRYHLKEYDTAWIDVENATKGLSNTRVYMLAGLIAYARKELPTAEQRFDRAYEIDSSACDATWMSGLVSIDREQLAVAAPKFTRGMSCFISSAAAIRRDRARLEAGIEKRGTPPTAREQRLLDRHQRDADTAEEKSAQSAFNAAQCYARTGGKAIALTHVDVAIGHPGMREKALALKAAIEKLPN
jgi:tetratricopeptide (TPR) repeat protein